MDIILGVQSVKYINIRKYISIIKTIDNAKHNFSYETQPLLTVKNLKESVYNY